jgi:hypothetical protein
MNYDKAELILETRLTSPPPILRSSVRHLEWDKRYGTLTGQLDWPPLRNGERSLRKDEEEQSAGDKLVEHCVSGW